MSQTRIEQLKSFLEHDPEDLFTRFALALEYLKQNEQKKAENIFVEIVRNVPDYIGVYYHLGKLYEQTGRPDEALATYADGIAICRKKRELHAMQELQQAMDELMDEQNE